MTNTFGSRLSDALDYYEELGRTQRDGVNAWNNLTLTAVGERYLEDAAEADSADDVVTAD